ncbi:MAG: hypothetical protein V1802_02295 [Candidatus Aenigmatarchaeota archaeon]
MMRKLKSYVIALELTTAPIILAGCATTNNTPQDIGTFYNDGYKALHYADVYLNVIAGIYAGTSEVRRTDDGFLVIGDYKQSEHPEAMKKALEDADTDKNKEITSEEASKLAQILFEKIAK